MRAVVIDSFGGEDRLHMAELATPAPREDEVLIGVECTSVNPVDWKIREGLLKDLFPHRFPLIPGWDAAGTVRALGAGVRDFHVGEAVYAYCRKPVVQFGTYAGAVAVAATAVAAMPRNLGFAEAATVPLAGLTAWQALFDFAGLGPGQRVLVHAGAGGVGGFAVQFARHAGARVLTTARAENHAYVLGLGAEHAIDYATQDFVAAARAVAPDGVDVVLDCVGGETQAASYGVLRAGGTLVSIVDEPDAVRAEAAGVRAGFVFVQPDGARLRAIARLFESGAVKAPQVEELPLAEAAAAQARSRAGHVRGKLVLRVA